MAIKGVTWIEQHFEKIVLGAVGATALGILGWQFVGRQSTISLNNKEIALDQANAELKAKALDIKTKIGAADPKMPEKFPVTAIATDFQNRHKAPVTRTRTLADGQWNPLPGATIGGAERMIASGGSEGPTNPLVVPVPATPIAEAYIATMLKVQLQDRSAAAADPNNTSADPLLPPNPENVTEDDLIDVAYVTVETVVDGPALLAALKLDPEGPTRAMPEHWWSGQIALLGLELERQEMQDNGEWGKSVIVRTSKFAATPLQQAGDPAMTGGGLRDLAKFATDQPEYVRRPHPPAPFIGEDWVAPSELERSRPNVAEQTRLRKEIDSIDEKLRAIDEQIKRTPNDAKNKSAIDRLNDRKRPLIIERNEKVAKYTELAAGPKPKTDETASASGTSGANVGKPTNPRSGSAGAPAPAVVEPLLATSGIRVWAHDTDVKRNRAYRYRARAVVSNPMYNQGAGLPPNQRDLAKSPLSMSEPTQWTQAVRVDPDLYYFVTSADDNKGEGAGPILTQEPSATAEVFSFKLGYWRTDSVRLRPGDPLVAEIPVPTLDQMRLAMAGNNNNGNPAPMDVPDRREVRQPAGSGGSSSSGSGGGGGGAKGTGGGGGGRVAPNASRPEPARPVTAQPPRNANNDPKPAQPPSTKPRIVPVSVPVFLLDVAAAPAPVGPSSGSGDRFQAFFRADDGTIEIRVPDDDRQQKAYQRVRMSSEAASLGAIRKIDLIKEPTRPTPGGAEKPPSGPGGG